MSEFLRDIAKLNEYGGIVEDGVETGDVDSFIDTGSYILNALLSGSVNGGLPANKITALAGESASITHVEPDLYFQYCVGGSLSAP